MSYYERQIRLGERAERILDDMRLVRPSTSFIGWLAYEGAKQLETGAPEHAWRAFTVALGLMYDSVQHLDSPSAPLASLRASERFQGMIASSEHSLICSRRIGSPKPAL